MSLGWGVIEQRAEGKGNRKTERERDSPPLIPSQKHLEMTWARVTGLCLNTDLLFELQACILNCLVDMASWILFRYLKNTMS